MNLRVFAWMKNPLVGNKDAGVITPTYIIRLGGPVLSTYCRARPWGFSRPLMPPSGYPDFRKSWPFVSIFQIFVSCRTDRCDFEFLPLSRQNCFWCRYFDWVTAGLFARTLLSPTLLNVHRIAVEVLRNHTSCGWNTNFKFTYFISIWSPFVPPYWLGNEDIKHRYRNCRVWLQVFAAFWQQSSSFSHLLCEVLVAADSRWQFCFLWGLNCRLPFFWTIFFECCFSILFSANGFDFHFYVLGNVSLYFSGQEMSDGEWSTICLQWLTPQINLGTIYLLKLLAVTYLAVRFIFRDFWWKRRAKVAMFWGPISLVDCWLIS